MKYIAKIFMLLAVGVFLFAGCSDDDEDLNGKVYTVMLNKKIMSLSVGQSETFIATVVPEKAINKNVTWTSDNTAVVTVNEAGEVTAVAAGEATVTVVTEDGQKTATCKVIVTVDATGILLNKTETTVCVGESETLIATVSPEETTDQKVMWKSDKVGIATVDSEGKVTGVAVGEVVITAFTGDGKQAATCLVTVEPAPIPVIGVVLNKNELSVEINKTETLVASILPADASNQNMIWKSDNTEVATVDGKGVVTGVKLGDATITVTTEDGNNTASCKVTVVKGVVKVTEIILDKFTLTLDRDAEFTLTATVKPDDATDRKVVWSSDNKEVVSVDENGKLKALKAGKSTITATANDGSGVTATCEVNVIVPVTSVAINPAELTLEVGKSKDLKVVIDPADATDKTVTWKSGNELVATVDKDGKVTAHATGEVTITATSANGKSGTCVITVLKVGGGIDYGDYDKEDWN